MIKKIKWRVVFAFVLSFVLLTMPATIGFAGVKAMEETGCPDVLSFVHNGVGNGAWTQGVRSYKVISSNDNEAIVEISGTSPSIQGTFYIQWHNPKKASMKLVRTEGTLSIEWDGNKGDFNLTDMEARSACSKFNHDTKSWVADSDLAKSIINENSEDAKLMGAISSDFNQIRVQKLSEKNSLIQAASLCADTANPVKTGAFGQSKSSACYSAKSAAASECSNQYCYGCYSYMSSYCDCYCQVGDYYCYCSITGFPCKECQY